MILETLPFNLTICKVPDANDVNTDEDFIFIEKTDQEISVVCKTENTPRNCTERTDGWKCFRIKGNLDFSLVGVLSNISGILAGNGIGIFVVSTYNTDYVLIKKEYFSRALGFLEKRGFEIMNC